VDHNLLRSWLGLPPGPWPPDHYTLLGLAPGRSDPAAVEPLVLDRMDRLRHHQLLHPELVTEGMNRLAQALITLTDPAGKAAYDAELGLPTAPPPTAPKPVAPPKPKPAAPPKAAPLVVARPVIDDVFADEAPVGLPADPDRTQVIEVPAFEVVEPPPPTGTLVVEAELLELPPGSVESPAGPAGVVEAVSVAPRGRAPADPESRRWVYARLALIRRAVRAWDKLRPVLADPDDALDRPGRVLILLDAVGEVRPLLGSLRGVLGEVGRPGGVVVALVNRPLILDTVRRLLPDQRHAVAADWRAGLAELRTEYARLRQLARAGRGGPAGPPAAVVLGRWFRDNPEWVLVLLAALAVFVALVRGPGSQ
jgi:hypothetical protein